MPVGLPGGEALIQGDGCGDCRHRQPLALLGSLDRIGSQAVEVEACRRCVLCEDWMKGSNAKLGGFFHQEIDGILLQGRKAQPDIGFVALEPPSIQQAQLDQAFVAGADLAGELAVAAIEDSDGIAHRPAQHRPQVVRRALVQGDACLGPQIGRHMEPWYHGVVAILGDCIRDRIASNPALQASTRFVVDADPGDTVCLSVLVNRNGTPGAASAEKCVDVTGG